MRRVLDILRRAARAAFAVLHDPADPVRTTFIVIAFAFMCYGLLAAHLLGCVDACYP